MESEFAELLEALQAIEAIERAAVQRVWRISEAWNRAPELRDGAERLRKGLAAAKEQRPDLVPLLNAVGDSADAKLLELQGRSHSVAYATRFKSDLSELRRVAVKKT
jgi:hypothetical protein